VNLALRTLFALLAAAAGGEIGRLTLPELMRRMADTPGVVARFVEKKEIALLDDPLETRGTMYFVPPNRLARRTEAPGASTLIIDGDKLFFRDEAGGNDVDLAGNPMARLFVDNFIVLFNGDLAELQRRYETSFATDDGHWTLTLAPRSAPLDRLVSTITLRGDDGGMREMVLLEKGGDRTTTNFAEVDAQHVFQPAELAKAFALPERKSR
jgi:hypothetical protein